jgi:hypothetical protein
MATTQSRCYCLFRCCESPLQHGKIVISLHYNFIWRTYWIISLLHVNCMFWVFKTVNLICRFSFTSRRKKCAFETLCSIFYMLWQRKQFQITKVIFRTLRHCQKLSTACHIFSSPSFRASTMLQIALTFANIHNEITNQSYFCDDSSLMGYSISPIFKTTLHFLSISIPQSQLYVQQYQVSSTIQNFLVME